MPFSDSFVRTVGNVGAAATWLIPVAAARNLVSQPAQDVNPSMPVVLLCYSAVFIRWAIAISPPNWALMACHMTNSVAQSATLLKWGYGRTLPPATKSE